METLQPKLRFPEFEGNVDYSYKKQSFEDVFLFSTGKNIKQNEASPEFETLCVRYGELYHMYDEVIRLVINRTNLNKSDLLFSQGDEILLPSAGEDPLDIGSASALTVENVAIGRTINILKPLKQNVYSNIYAAYYINHKLRAKIATLAKGVSISNVYNSDLKTLEIILPTLEEQTRIANFLSSVDEKLNLLKEKRSLLEEYKKGIMQKIFNQELGFKDDNGNDFEDWKESILSEVVNLFHGYQFRTSDFTSKGIAVIKISNVIGNNLDLNNLTFIKKERFEDFKSFEIKNDDILMSLTGNIGRIIEVKDKPFSLLQNYRVGKFIPLDENVINKPFLKYLLASDLVFGRFSQLANQSAQANFGKQDMDKINISYPTIEEQNKISNFLSTIDEKIELVSNQIQDTQEYKKGLLQQMFV